MALDATDDAWWAGSPAIRFTRWMPHIPEPTQHAFLWLDCLEGMFGGAAGGGKSDTLLMAAAQYFDVPGYAALILRRTYADLALPGAIMSRSKEWWMDSDLEWSEQNKQWVAPSGASLTFGYLQYENDVYRYQSAEFQFIGIDESTQIEMWKQRYLLSRLRRPSAPANDPSEDTPEQAYARRLSQVPLRMRCATNPGGRAHKEYKARYVDRLPDEDDPEDTPEKAAKRVFIPSKLDDNPHVDREAYKMALAGLDPRTRKQLLEGDWSVREPGAWVYDETHVDIAKDIGRDLDALRRVGQIQPVGGHLRIAADFGTHTHILVLWPLEGGGWYVVKEIVFDGYDITKAVAPTLAAIEATGFRVERFDFDGSMPGLATIFHDALKKSLGYKFKYLAVPFNKFKRLTIQHISWMLDRTANDHWPRLAISPTGAPRLIEQMERLYYDDPETDRIHKEDDHGPDALIAGLAEDASKRDHRFKEKTAA